MGECQHAFERAESVVPDARSGSRQLISSRSIGRFVGHGCFRDHPKKEGESRERLVHTRLSTGVAERKSVTDFKDRKLVAIAPPHDSA